MHNKKPKPFRLQLHNKYILSFDRLERDFTQKNFDIKNHAQIISYIDFIGSGNFVLTNGLLLELLTQQRFKTFFLKNIHQKVSLSKKKYLILVDIYLNSISLKKLSYLSFSNVDLNDKLYFLASSQLLNTLSLNKFLSRNKLNLKINLFY